MLFKKQTVVDRYVDILAFTFGVQRADLNVVRTRSLKRVSPDPNNARRQQQKVWR